MKWNPWDRAQLETNNRIASLPTDEQARELLKWVLSRLEAYAPDEEPLRVAVRQFLDEGTLQPRWIGQRLEEWP